MKEFILIYNDNKIPSIKQIYDFNCDVEIKTVDDVLLLMKNIYSLDILESERAYLIGFDDNNYLIGCYCISIGDYNSTIINDRTIATVSLLIGAKSVLVLHNHPNDNLISTIDDMIVNSKTEKVIDIIGLNYIGGYVVSKSGWKKIGSSSIHEWRI